MKFIRDALEMLLSSCQLTQNLCVNNALLNHSPPATTAGYTQCDPQNTVVYLLATFRFHTRQRIPWLVRKLLTFLKTVLHEIICLLNKYFEIFLWLSFAVWVLTLNSWTLWMHEKVTKVLLLLCAIQVTHTLFTAHYLVSL